MSVIRDTIKIESEIRLLRLQRADNKRMIEELKEQISFLKRVIRDRNNEVREVLEMKIGDLIGEVGNEGE